MSINASNKTVAYYGALVAVSGVFAYSIAVMIYVIARTSTTIYSIMPDGERNTILLTSGFSIAYSVAIFSIILAALSSIAGAVSALILKKSLQYFNPLFNSNKAILISCITAIAQLFLLYILLYTLLKKWMTFEYAETFMFWFFFPAILFLVISIVSGRKLNTVVDMVHAHTD